MKRKYISTISILALAMGAPLTPSLAGAQSPQSDESVSPARVRIDVDTQALGERGTGLEAAITKNLRAAFEAGGVELVEGASADASLLRIRFSGKAEDVQAYDYHLHFELVEGHTATRLIEPVRCVECFDHVLFEELEALVPSLIAAIEAEAKAGVGDPGAIGPVATDTATSEKTPRPSLIGPLGGIGIGVATLGLGALVWGAVDLSRGRVYDESPGSVALRRTWTDHTPRGQALLGVGIASFAVGGALLITDIVIRSKRRKQHDEKTGVVVPLTSSQVVGLSWARRF